ncbi:MAG: hypothetical protein ACLVL7_09695, partial [Anaerotruncus massiliensis (ex Togo et al. 2019)]
FKTEFAASRVNPVYSYFTDYVIDQVIDDLMEQYGYTNQVAQQMVTSGGLRIYTTVDERVQDIVTNFYSDVKNFPTVTNEGEYPQSAAAILDPNGKIIALAGGIGEKRGMREFNRATDAYRQCGSSIKPISAYLQAVERRGHWSQKSTARSTSAPIPSSTTIPATSAPSRSTRRFSAPPTPSPIS